MFEAVIVQYILIALSKSYKAGITSQLRNSLYIIYIMYIYIPTNSNSINTQHTDIFSFGNESKNNLIIVETV